MFEYLTQAIFDNLNVKVLYLWNVKEELLTTEFYDMIKNCHSLRSVTFIENEHAHTQLDVIEGNSNVNQWIIDFRLGDIDKSVKERVQEIL